MNRRSLLKLLAGAACAAAIEITGLRPLLPKAARWEINPHYLTASYEDIYVSSNSTQFTLRVERNPEPQNALVMPPLVGEVSAVGSYEALDNLPPKGVHKFPDTFIPRYNFIDGPYVQVHPLTLQS